MWWKIAAGVVMNFVAWAALGTLMLVAARIMWPEYASAEPTRAFDLAMMVMRLSASSVASIGAAYIAATTVRESKITPIAAALLMLALFVPYHVTIWDWYPAWYHLTFFVSIPVFAVLGGRLARN